MKRRIKGVDFARIWGEVSKWGQQDRNELLGLLREVADQGAEPKKREPRKPKSGVPEGGAT